MKVTRADHHIANYVECAAWMRVFVCDRLCGGARIGKCRPFYSKALIAFSSTQMTAMSLCTFTLNEMAESQSSGLNRLNYKIVVDSDNPISEELKRSSNSGWSF